MAISNGLSDIILTSACLYSIINLPITKSFFISYAAGFLSIGLAAFFGSLYFLGLNSARKMHLFFIKISSNMGIFGIALGKILSLLQLHFGVGFISSELTFFIILVSIALMVLLPDNNLIFAYASIASLVIYCVLQASFSTFIALFVFLSSVLLKEKKVRLGMIDDIDLFHLLLSFAMILFYKSIHH